MATFMELQLEITKFHILIQNLRFFFLENSFINANHQNIALFIILTNPN